MFEALHLPVLHRYGVHQNHHAQRRQRTSNGITCIMVHAFLSSKSAPADLAGVTRGDM